MSRTGLILSWFVVPGFVLPGLLITGISFAEPLRTSPPLHRAGQWYGSDQEVAVSDPDAGYDAVHDRWTVFYSSHMARTYTDQAHSYGVIRLAIKQPDQPWEIRAAPALGKSPGGWDSLRVETPSVVYQPTAPADQRYKLFYSGASRMNPGGFPEYKIGLAISGNGYSYQRVGEPVLEIADLFPDREGVGGVVADPEVIAFGETLHMYFSAYAHDPDGGLLYYGIIHATSVDGLDWVIQESPAAGAAQPSVVRTNRGIELYYTRHQGNELATVPSTFHPTVGVWKSRFLFWGWVEDGSRPFTWQPSEPYERFGLMTGVDVVWAKGRRHYFYSAWSDLDAPAGFYVPTNAGYQRAALSLLHASE